MVQLEEAYARATVAITRARALCLIMGPLDMKGLLGAATVMGTLMYGAGHVWAGHAHFYLHDHELSRSPPDESFIDMLQQNCCRQSKKVLFAASRQEANSGLGKDNRMSCHAGTSGDPSGDNGVLGRRDPIAGTEQIGHIIAIVQNGQVRLGISTEITAFSQPVYNRSNVLDSMRVGAWNIPKNSEEATSLRSLMGDELAKIPTCSIECDQLGVPYPNHCLICDLGDPCAAG